MRLSRGPSSSIQNYIGEAGKITVAWFLQQKLALASSSVDFVLASKPSTLFDSLTNMLSRAHVQTRRNEQCCSTYESCITKRTMVFFTHRLGLIHSPITRGHGCFLEKSLRKIILSSWSYKLHIRREHCLYHEKPDLSTKRSSPE